MFWQKQFGPPDPADSADLPEKTGVARFLEVLGDNYSAVLKVNLLFLLTCIPVVTIPAALYTLHHTARLMAQGRIVRVSHYMDSFRHNWKRSYVAFALTALPQAMSGVGMWFYLQRAGTQLLFLLPFVFCTTVFLITLLSSLHLYALMNMGYHAKEAIRLALMLGVGKPARSVLAVLCSYGLPLGGILAFPISLPFLLLIGFSLPDILGNFFLRTVWKQHLDPNDQ